MIYAEMESPFTPLGQEMLFSLVWQSRQRAVRYHALLVILPFLGLNGQCQAAVQGHGRYEHSPLLWPVLRWFNWAGGRGHQQEVNRVPTATGPLATVVNQVAATDTSPWQAKMPGEQTSLLTLLAPVLLMTRLPQGTEHWPQRSHSLPSGRSIPVIVPGSTQKDPLISTPIPILAQTAILRPQPVTGVNQPKPLAWSQLPGKGEAVSSAPIRTGTVVVTSETPITSEATAADALPDRNTLPARAGQRPGLPEPPALPGLNPSLMGIWAVAAGTYAVRHQAGLGERPSTPSMTPATLTFNRAVMLPPAADSADRMASSPSRHLAAPTARPTIAGEVQNGRELTHYAPSPTQGLTIVTSAIERWMKQAVTAEIKRQKESEAQQNDRQQEVPAPTTSEYFNDDMVRRLMLRMHDLAQEDRFRMGRIR